MEMIKRPPLGPKRSLELLAKIHLLFGEAELLIKERLTQLKRDLGGEALNVEQIDSPRPELETLTSALQSQSLF